MKARLFKLTKPEQRVVIFILLALLAGAFIKHYRDTHSNGFERKAPSSAARVSATASPPSPPPDPEEQSDD